MPITDSAVFNKQHAVPQNIMDVEFKIIGDLTLRQFAYLGIFGAVAYLSAVYMTGLFRWPVVIVCSLLGLALAFVPVQERGLDQWIVNFFIAVYSPTQKIWRKDAIVPAVFLYQNLNVVKQELITLAPTSSRRKLEEFLNVQNKSKKEDRLDMRENDFIKFVKDSYAEALPQTTVGEETFVAPSTEDFIANDRKENVEIPQEPAVVATVPEVVKTAPSETFTPTVSPQVKSIISTPITNDQFTTPKVVSQPVIELPQQAQPQPIQQVRPQQEQQPQLVSTNVRVPTYKITSPIRPVMKAAAKILKRPQGILLSPMTPDQHSGRRFTSLLPKQGEIVLPIRGERVLKTSEEMHIETDMQEKTEQLNKLIAQIKNNKGFVANKEVSTSTQSAAVPQPSPVVEEVKVSGTSGDALTSVQIPVQQVEPVKQVEPATPKQVQEIIAAAPLKVVDPNVAKQAKDLAKSIEEDAKLLVANSSPMLVNTPNVVVTDTIFTSVKPNTLVGTIKNTKGESLDGIVVLIKNDRGEAVRAMKTNTLGQFTLVTPLANGVYKIEVDSAHKSAYLFDIISVEARGEVIPQFEIVSH